MMERMKAAPSLSMGFTTDPTLHWFATVLLRSALCTESKASPRCSRELYCASGNVKLQLGWLGPAGIRDITGIRDDQSNGSSLPRVNAGPTPSTLRGSIATCPFALPPSIWRILSRFARKQRPELKWPWWWIGKLKALTPPQWLLLLSLKMQPHPHLYTCCTHFSLHNWSDSKQVY